jgi:hypothetical protein
MDAEQDADYRTDHHGENIGCRDAGQRYAEIEEQLAARRLPDQCLPDFRGRGERTARPGLRRQRPQQAEPEQGRDHRRRRH